MCPPEEGTFHSFRAARQIREYPFATPPDVPLLAVEPPGNNPSEREPSPPISPGVAWILPAGPLPIGHTVPVRDTTARFLSRLHATLYRTTRGRIGTRFVNNDMLLLTTTGRVSARPHTVPLLYLRDGSNLVVIASWGGRDYHPDWFLNLVAHPTATVNINGERHDVVARTATRNERAIWWPQVLEAYDGYAAYQRRTHREIPLVFLEPKV